MPARVTGTEILDALNFEQPCELTVIHTAHGTGPAEWILRSHIHCIDACGVILSCDGCFRALSEPRAAAITPCCGTLYKPAWQWVLVAERLRVPR